VVCIAALWSLIAYRNRSEWTASDMARALPSDDAVIAYFDVAAMRSTGILQLVAGTKSVEELDYRRFVNDSGFDYKSDLDRLAISFRKKSRYAIAVGRFDWPKIKAYAIQNGAVCLNAVCEVKGKPLENTTSLYPIQGSALALASTPHAGGVYQVTRTPAPAGPNDPWPASSAVPVWVSVPGTIWRDSAALPSGVKSFASALGNAKHTVFSIEPGAGRDQLTLHMRVDCNDAADAQKMLQQLTETTSILRKMMARDGLTPKPADLAGLLTNGSFEISKGVQVTGKWPLAMALLQSLAEGNIE
jgi:hypothetical protein